MENKRRLTGRYMTQGIGLTLSLLLCLFSMVSAHSMQDPDAKLPKPNRPAASSSDTARDQCSAKAKEDLYASFVRNRTTDQAQAYNDAQDYLRCPAGAATETEQKIINYLKKFSAAYDTAIRKNELIDQLIDLLYNEKKYPEAYTLGREILAKDPDNLMVFVHLGVNGYLVLNNPSVASQGLNYARLALQEIESGKSLEDWKPLQGREVALAYLNYTIGSATLETAPNTALKYLMKAAEFETPLKKSPYTYAYIAAAYETGDYAKQSEEYNRLYRNRDETPESKVALANINLLVDRIIDGYARAVALAGNDPKFANAEANWRESLTTWYKYRNNDSTAGLTALISNVLSRRLPPFPTPITRAP